MSMWPDWLKAIQLKARYLFGIWLLGCMILFIPNNIANVLKINELRNSYGLWIGLATVAGFCFWLVQIFSTIKDWNNERSERRDLLKSIFYLPLEQKVVLAVALYRNSQIIPKPISDSLIDPLWKRGMIEAMGDFDECFDSGPCKIVNYVWRFIKRKRRKVLTEDIKKQLQKDNE